MSGEIRYFPRGESELVVQVVTRPTMRLRLCGPTGTIAPEVSGTSALAGNKALVQVAWAFGEMRFAQAHVASE